MSNRNGSSIVADYSVPGAERNTVVLRDQTRITFENSGDTQRIFNGSDQLISEAVWGTNGPVSQPIVRPAFSDRGRIGRGLSPLSYPAEVIVDAATELYNWWLSTKEPGEETVFTFRADKLLRDVEDEPPTWISNLRREEVEAACPRFPVVQQIVNSAAAPLKRNMFKNDGAYGTVHMSVKWTIDTLGDANLKTELSIIKTNSAETKYGTKGSVRIDILEKINEQMICVYDLKTGQRGLTRARLLEIYGNVISAYKRAYQIVIIEIRPAP